MRLRDNDQLSAQGRWIMNDLLDELEHVSEKISRLEAHLQQLTATDRRRGASQRLDAGGMGWAV